MKKSLKDQLKPIKAQARPSALPVLRPAAPSPEPEPDFRQLFADVTPLKHVPRHAHTPPKPRPKPRKQQQEIPLSATLHAELMRHAVGWFEPAEADHSFAKPGQTSSTLRRLRAGHWPVAAELDLHGFDRFSAQERLALFLHRARRFGVCVRIIHGKGFGSVDGEPVLKRMVRGWLKHHPDVLAYCEADDRCGGHGALLVLLRTLRPHERHED
ncbi:Smr/MutS family protein [Crenobacter sp. SG2305]|uniref:Smr/MutS family protein n=1 Tax=Crenobacter oryzisoli TaxID=3056844 RepID=UPI0025AAA5C9|nr:Smr/MutS family protein [Crenobacter sp. SG2305]MDN0084570.1 Smr/MutS family protein [Crenobacter sp. SG2305]